MLKAFWEEAGKSLYFRTSQMTESDSNTLKQSQVKCWQKFSNSEDIEAVEIIVCGGSRVSPTEDLWE